LVELKEDLAALHADRLQKATPAGLEQLAKEIHRETRQLLTSSEKLQEAETVFRLSHAELESGKGVDAVLDLIRAQEKIVSSALGPNQSKSFLARITDLIERG
jgi:hypothetical protein